MAMSIEELRSSVNDLHTRVEELRNFLKIEHLHHSVNGIGKELPYFYNSRRSEICHSTSYKNHSTCAKTHSTHSRNPLFIKEKRKRQFYVLR